MITAAETQRLAAAEGLTLVRSVRSQTGFKGVKCSGRGFRARVGGRWTYAKTAEYAALLRARHYRASSGSGSSGGGAAAPATARAACVQLPTTRCLIKFLIKFGADPVKQ